MVDAISIYVADHGGGMDAETTRLAEMLPSRHQITTEEDETKVDLMGGMVDEVWRRLSGKVASESVDAVSGRQNALDGCYWLVPGGILLKGLNHYSAAKEHKGLICQLLGISGIDMERMLASGDPAGLISLVVAHGGVRVLVNRERNEVWMQTSEASWAWARLKMSRLPHRHKVVKVVDLSVPYRGWQTGISLHLP